MEEVNILNQTGDKGNGCHSSQMAFPFLKFVSFKPSKLLDCATLYVLFPEVR